MIRTVAELLKELINFEKEKLDQYDISHGPTIGSMYEGLTEEVLRSAFPEEIGLKVVTGFITDAQGTLSKQIDCMLVCGKGERIPKTQSFKWNVKNVVAVVEVKKRLFSGELGDSYANLLSVITTFRSFLGSDQAKTIRIDNSPTEMAFERITGIAAPDYNKVNTLGPQYSGIYHTLMVEQFSPIRIVLGYDGFKSEASLRRAFAKFLKKNLRKKGFGVGSFPQLIICGQFSLIKLNGFPYSGPIENGFWNFFGSTRANPILLILEFIWTRLDQTFGCNFVWGEDLDLEVINKFIQGRITEEKKLKRWEYIIFPADEKVLGWGDAYKKWEPIFLNHCQFIVFSLLGAGEDVSIKDDDLIKLLKENHLEKDSFVESLTSTGLIVLDGDLFKLSGFEVIMAILPDGRYLVAENNTGRFGRWLSIYNNESKTKLK